MIKTVSTNPNYLASIVSLPAPEKHPNADRLQVVKIFFNSIITGLDAKEGMIYVYFPLESAINKEYLAWSNSFESKEMNADQNVKGYFPKTGRVRAASLRQQKSEGYIVPVSSVASWLKTKGIEISLADYVGLSFDTIGDILLCEKYVVQNQKGNGGNKQGKTKKKKESKIIPDVFKFHVDTDQLKRNMHKINPDDDIVISYKLHGTSAIFANLPCRRSLTWKDKVAKFLGVAVQDTHYDYIFSSRRVVKNDHDSANKEHYYATDIWNETGTRLKASIQQGISIYAEIVGQLSTGGWIQKEYDYGTNPNQSDVYVYRITFTSPDGLSYEFNRKQMEEYCEKYELKVVPLFYRGKAKDRYPELSLDEHWHENYLNNLISDYNEKDCYLCRNKVPEEGIVVLKEKLTRFDAFKLKSFKFLKRETEELDAGVENIEDAQPTEEEIS